jgi:hypothetical protein
MPEEEVKMKIATGALFFLLLCVGILGQTVDLGQNVFYNDEGDIVMAAVASVAVRKLDSPYIMFMLYMATKEARSITVSRNDVVMIYKNKEYKMPTIKEFKANYKGEVNDMVLYRHMGKDSLVLSRMRNWGYPTGVDFFPLPQEGVVTTDEGSMSGNVGFMTKVYFKNPGFKKGDELIIKVKDKENPDIYGSVAIVLQ